MIDPTRQVIRRMLTEAEDEYYHVTLTDRVPDIQKRGLAPMQSSNWSVSGTGERYGQGEVFAFENKFDAIRWASKMDWDLNQTMGSGNISIVTFRPNGEEWEIDTADPLSQASAEGRWLKRMSAVPPEDILNVEPLTQDMTRALVQHDREALG